MAPTATSGKTKEAAPRGRSASTSGDRKRPRKPSLKKGAAGTAGPPSAAASKSLLLPFITLWLIAVVALAGLVYWGIEAKSPSTAIQKKVRSQPSPDPGGTTIESRKQTLTGRMGQVAPPAARQANPGTPSRKESAQPIKEYDITADLSPAKPSASDRTNPRPRAESANPSDRRAAKDPKGGVLTKPVPSAGVGPPESTDRSNTSEIQIDVTPLEASQAKPQEPGRPVESSARGPGSSTRSSETLYPNHASPTRSHTTAEAPVHPDPHDAPPSGHSDTAQANHGSLLALMSPANGPGSAPPLAPHPPAPLTATPVARVAIVIDDFGPDTEIAKKYLSLPIAITFSILPYQRHSQDIAQLAHSQHREVLLHMPMEPRGYPTANPGKGALLVSMSADTMQRTVQTALNASPYISGMNNHMGSRFTENPAFMKIVLSEIGQRKLYFLDSCTSPKSAGTSIAHELHIPSGKRDIFLDHKPSENVTRSQIEQLIRKAKIQGTAIAIGHPHESTLRALQKHSDRFRQEKIAVVSAGEIVGESVNGLPTHRLTD